jgi:CheY-like chemotaxis protein
VTQRRILLVDNDQAFHRLLSDQIGPYGFEVVPANPADPDVLSRVTQLEPTLLIIAVDEPDKLGYSLCNKAKKGVAAKLPVILATSTVTPEGFANHRRLKLHADEYIDKRDLSPHELVGKIDNLVELGDLGEPSILGAADFDASDDLGLPVEVEDLSLDLAEAEVVEQIDSGLGDFADDGGQTQIASEVTSSQVVDATVDSDLDGAFAAITDFSDVSDDEPVAARGGPQAAPAPRGRRTEPPPLPPPARRDADEPAPATIAEAVVAAPRPTPRPTPQDYTTEESSLGIPEPIHAVDGHGATDPGEADAPAPAWRGGVIPEPIDPGDFGVEATATGAGAGVPAAEPADAPAAAAPADPTAGPVGIDLGLDEVYARADAEQSGVHDRRTLQKIHTLERDNARLKAELDKARQGDGGGRTQGREKEFLHLRQMIATKDKEILELRDELVAKDREILDGKEHARKLQHTKTQLESKNLELEQRIVGDAEEVEAVELAKQELEVQIADLTARLAAVEVRAKADAEVAARALADKTQLATGLDRDLIAVRAKLADADHKHADAIAALTRTRDAAEATLREELDQAHATALDALRAELGAAHASRIAATEAEHADALTARDAERASAIAAADAAAQARVDDAETAHAAALATQRAEAQAALAVERARAADALAAEKARVDHAVAAETARADEAAAQAAARADEAIAAEKARAADLVATASARAQEDLVAVMSAHQGEVERLAGEHERQLGDQRTQLEGQLAQTRAAAVAEHDRLVAEHAAAVAAIAAERDALKGELDDARAEADKLRGDLEAFAERAQRDLATAAARGRQEVESARAEGKAAVAAVQADKAELEQGLSSARDQIKRLEDELATARETIVGREKDVDAHAAAVRERDQRLVQLRGELDELEKENAGYQEQVLKAYQKIKADEARFNKLQKALAIGLTLAADDEKKAEG